MINPMQLLQAKESWERVKKNHPKLVPFGRSLYPNAIREGTVFDIRVTEPDGIEYHGNIRLKAEDVEEVKNVLAILRRPE